MIQNYGNPERRIKMSRMPRNNRPPRPATKPAKEVVEKVEEPLATGLDAGLKENVEIPAQPQPIKAVVANCKKVRVRKTPNTHEDNVIAELKEGTEVVVLDSSNPGWTLVDLGAQGAWIMSDYLKSI
jgi:uncharacterized protein YgiM (DUF1202 family)